MCGIAGIVGLGESAEHDILLASILRDQDARGPDARAFETVSLKYHHCLLGHNRLKILDLSSRADQPMWDRDSRLCVSFNGEIYNYLELKEELSHLGFEFITSCDTEIILYAYKAWGLDCFSRFNGAFAIALLDIKQDKLVLARDRFGKKPLYYTVQNGQLYFASTGRVLANALGLRPNLSYVAKGLSFNLYEDDADISQYEGLYAIPAGHFQQVNLKEAHIQLNIHRYYDLHSRVKQLRAELKQISDKELISYLTENLEQSVNIRLRSDVDVCIALSGGLDSSAIAATVKKQQDIEAFTFGNRQIKQTEAGATTLIAEKLGIKLNTIWPSQDEFNQAILDTLRLQDAPFPSFSIVAQQLVFKAMHDKGYKVALGGQGGDEALMGYRKFLIFYAQQLFRDSQFRHLMPFLYYLLPTVLAETSRFKTLWQLRNKYIRTKGMSHRLNLPEVSCDGLRLQASPDLWQRQLADITRFSLPTLLRYEDRNSLGNSVESRLPMVDYRFIELGLALPERLKLHKGYGKWILRHVMKNHLPKSILWMRRKRGFEGFDETWLKNGAGDFLLKHLRAKESLIKSFLPKGESVTSYYPLDRLLSEKNTLAEILSLLWLGEKLG